MSTPPVHCAHAELVPLAELKEHPRNPNRHPQSQIDLLVKLIERTGWRHPIVVSRRSGCVVAGHGRLYAARTAGWTEAPVDFQEFASDAEEQAHLVADNRLAELSNRDDAVLAAILRELQGGGNLELTGYGDAQLDKLLSRLSADDPAQPGPAEPAPDPNKALAEKWGTASGQIWTLGFHRLAIGDSEQPETWHRLLGSEQLQLINTDPPYGIAYQDSKGRSIANDDLRLDDLAGFLTRVFQLAVRHSIPECPFYVWHASDTRDDFSFALKSAGLSERQYITWVKEGFVLGRCDYHWQSEHAFYAARQGQRPHWYGDRSQSTCWRVAGQTPQGGTLVSKEGILITDGNGRCLHIKETAPPKGSKVRHFRVAPGESLTILPEEPTTAWCVSRDPTGDYVHPNQKPVELAARAIRNSSAPGDLVGDCFAGSGSTLMACEQLHRRARVVELCPLNAAAIIQRWHDSTGQQPRLAA